MTSSVTRSSLSFANRYLPLKSAKILSRSDIAILNKFQCSNHENKDQIAAIRVLFGTLVHLDIVWNLDIEIWSLLNCIIRYRFFYLYGDYQFAGICHDKRISGEQNGGACVLLHDRGAGNLVSGCQLFPG